MVPWGIHQVLVFQLLYRDLVGCCNVNFGVTVSTIYLHLRTSQIYIGAALPDLAFKPDSVYIPSLQGEHFHGNYLKVNQYRLYVW